MTPGGLALAAVKPSPSFLQSLRSALSEPRPEMRLVGARIISVANVDALTEDVAAALAREQDELVAAEQLRALLLLNTSRSLALAEGYVPGATVPPTIVFTRWLARTDPERLIERLPVLTSRLAPADRELVFSDALLLALAYRPNLRAQTLQRVLAEAGPAWQWVLPYLFEPSRPATDNDLLVEALASTHDEVRERTVWNVVARLGKDAEKQVGKRVLDAALPRPADTADRPTWEAFGRELVARFRLKRETPDRLALFASTGPAHMKDMLSLRDSPVLRPSETDALRALLGSRFSVDRKPGGSTETPKRKPRSDTMRTAPFLAEGFYADLAASAGCVAPARGAVFPLILTFDTTGRPSKATISGTPDTNCRAAMAGLAQVTIADDGEVRKTDQRDWVLFPVGAVSGCTDTRPDVVKPLDGHEDADFSPQLLQSAQPLYTTAALRGGVQGTVFADGTITRGGCVRDINVRNALDNGLEIEAILALLQWDFSPAVIDGQSTSVRAKFEMRFRIRAD